MKIKYKIIRFFALAILLNLTTSIRAYSDVTPFIQGPYLPASLPETLDDREAVENLKQNWISNLENFGACSDDVITGDLTGLTPRSYDGIVLDANTIDISIDGNLVTISNRDMDGPLLGSPGGELLVASLATPNDQLQDLAPRPESLYDNSGVNTQPGFYNENSGDLGSRNAILFEFNSPLNAFGAWFGDLESRTLNIDSSPGPAAIVRFFDNTNTQVGSDFLVPSGPGNQNDCGTVLPGISVGCGNRSTYFIGFIAEDTTPISKMLVIVGSDNTFSDAGNDHISMIGPTLVNEFNCRADVEIKKLASFDNPVFGQTFTYNLVIINHGPGIANNVEVIDNLPAAVKFAGVQVSNEDISCNEIDNAVTCTLATMEARTAETISIIVIPTDITGFTNTATITSDEDNSNNNNNTATISLTTVAGSCEDSCQTTSHTQNYTEIDSLAGEINSLGVKTKNYIRKQKNIGICDENAVKNANKILKTLEKRYLSIWTDVWKLPASIVSCSSTLQTPDSCISTSLTNDKNGVEKSLNSMNSNANKIMSTTCIDNSAGQRRYRRSLNRVYNKALSELEKIPDESLNCQ